MGRDGGEASAKERRCQVKFALTEGERRASSCGRRRTHYEMRKEEGGLLKIFAAVNISRGEKKKIFLPVLSANIIYVRAYAIDSVLPSVHSNDLATPALHGNLPESPFAPLPPRFAKELRRYLPSSRH